MINTELYQFVNGFLNIATVMDATASSFLVVNEKTEVLFNNKSFAANNLADTQLPPVQPGDLLECINSVNSPHGCGTSEECPNCKFRNAIKQAFATNKITSCEIVLALTNDRILAIRTTVSPFVFNNTRYAAIFNIDIYDSIRKRMSERLFFHDIFNQIGKINNSIQSLWSAKSNTQQFALSIRELQNMTSNIVDTITFQRDLIAAENEEFNIEVSNVDLNSLFTTLHSVIQPFNDKGCKIDVQELDIATTVETDARLLQHILFEMLKNAIEFVEPHSTIRLSVKMSKQTAIFCVNNPGVVSEQARNTIFHFGSTTKNSGHGLGTYSMKLWTDKYLKGKVWFESTEAKGTSFFLQLPLTFASKTI